MIGIYQAIFVLVRYLVPGANQKSKRVINLIMDE